AFDVIMIKAPREVPFGKVRLETQRFQCFRICLLLPLLGRLEEMVQDTGGCRKPRMSESEVWVELNRLIVKIYRCLKILEQVIRSPLIIAAAQIEDVSVGVGCRFCFNTGF